MYYILIYNFWQVFFYYSLILLKTYLLISVSSFDDVPFSITSSTGSSNGIVALYIFPEFKEAGALCVMSLTMGATPQDTKRIPFKRIMRPMYPIDEI